MAGNDLCDIEKDRELRPSRPLPSSRLGIQEVKRAMGMILALFVLNLFFLDGRQTLFFVLALIGIFLYNHWLREPFLLAVLMASGARLFNGWAGLSGELPSSWWLILGGSLFFHTIGIFFLAEGENLERPLHKSDLWPFALVVVLLLGLDLCSGIIWAAVMGSTLLLLGRPGRSTRIRLVGTTVGHFNLLASCICFGTGHLQASLFFLCFAVVGKAWSKRFPVG